MNVGMKKYLLALILSVSSIIAIHASDDSKYRFHCDKDTARINEMLSDISSKNLSKEGRILRAAELMEGIPYVAHTLEGDPEKVTINVHEQDCIIFVETCYALAKAAERRGSSWRDFARHIEDLRYRKGAMNGYASRLHYSADWVNDNIYRGNVTEVTATLPDAAWITKTLDYMTSHREMYEALKDSDNYDAIKEVERGFHSLRYPYIRKEGALKKNIYENFCDGDMVVILSKEPGIDSSHVSLIRVGEDGKPYMIHAGLKAGKVVREKQTFGDYLKYNRRSSPGFRLIRLAD